MWAKWFAIYHFRVTIRCYNRVSKNQKGGTMTKTHKMLVFVLALLLGAMLSGCGGKAGGGGKTNATSNQWDKMSWDQGKWG